MTTVNPPAPSPIPPARARSLRRRFDQLAPEVKALRGRRAGISSRGIAWGIDVVIMLFGYPIVVWIWGAVIALVNLETPTYPALPDWAEVLLPLAWNWAYLTFSWVLTGRTIGMSVMGLKVVARKQVHVGIVRANIRFVVLFWTVLWIGPIWLACSRSRLALHDRAAHTQVIYDGATRQEMAVTGLEDTTETVSTD